HTNLNFGGGVLNATTGFVVAKYSASGAYLWGRGINPIGSAAAWAVTVDSAGNVIVVGRFTGTADFGGGSVTTNPNYVSDAFVVKYAPDGSYLWLRQFGQIYQDSAYSVAADPSGNVIFPGIIEATHLARAPFSA